jgi:predicted CXXCH cytochrome family protein
MVASVPPSAKAAEDARFVGSSACRPCHAVQFSSWSASQHARAMQEATADHVLGRVGEPMKANPHERKSGVNARFFRDASGMHVEAEGPDGRPGTYDIAFTFGVAPLQQYLARFPGGRLQALPVAWDSRRTEDQGQRWFQLYPDVLDHRDQLHWTGPYQNWNMMCAECHVTGFVKAYDAKRDEYASKWSELGVGCEACHGPASAHLRWAEAGAKPVPAGSGFVRHLKARGEFRFNSPTDRIAARADARSPDANAECAACHARAGSIDDGARSVPRTALTQHHRPALLVPPEYWPTGEQHDEVFIWGSFAASKMAARGVTCGDCHEPHSGARLADGNALCVRCHQPAVFDVPAHHHHAQGGEGSRCVDCHMASERYMVVDPRRDHSFQLPRPDLTLETGSPNACNRCHRKEKPEWAAAQLDAWSGKAWRERPHWARAFASAQRHSSAAQKPLVALALDGGLPAIVRASALKLLRDVPRAAPEPRLLSLVDDTEPLVRSEALPLLEGVEPPERWRRARSHLEDEDRLVRLEAAELLSGLSPDVTASDGAGRLHQAFAELTRSLEQQTDFPANAVQLGQLYLRASDLTTAERWFQQALTRDPQFESAYVRLSELHRVKGDQDASARVLERGLERLPKSSQLHYASGLALVRLGKKGVGTARLARAAELAPDDAGIAYTYSVALQDQNELPRAVEVLERTLRSQPENGELLEELLRIGLQSRRVDIVRRHLPAFERLFPDDPSLPVLRAALQTP